MRRYIISEQLLQALGEYFTAQQWRIADPFLKELAKSELLVETKIEDKKPEEVNKDGNDK